MAFTKKTVRDADVVLYNRSSCIWINLMCSV